MVIYGALPHMQALPVGCPAYAARNPRATLTGVMARYR
jgi:hypothetical protein